MSRQEMNIEADAGAKAFAKADAYINASPAQVYQILADINNWPSWQKDVSQARCKGKTEEGRSFTWKNNGMSIKSRLHTATEPRALGWTGQVWWYKAIHNWHIHPSEKGTHLVVVESMTGFGAGLMLNMLRKGVKQNVMELKAAAEKVAAGK